MYPWNNLTTLLLAAGTKILESALDELSLEAVADLVAKQGPEKACELLLGIYHALEKLYASSTMLREALVQWVQVTQQMADHQLKYAPQWAQDQLLAGITAVEQALTDLTRYVELTGVLAVRFRGSSRYSRELIEGRLMEILEPQQYHLDAGAPRAARSLFIARLKHLITLEDANIQRIEEVGGQLAAILKNEFGLE
jgi:hypothetical protein